MFQFRISHILRQLSIGLSEILISTLRPTPFNCRLKCCLLRIRGSDIGENVYIHKGVWINDPSKLSLNDECVLSKDVLITTNGGVKIGKRSLIGYGSKILSANHIIPEDIAFPIRYSGHEIKPITIEDDVWVASNVLITPGVNIGTGSVVSAGSIVTRDIDPYTIVSGAPAKVIRKRGK